MSVGATGFEPATSRPINDCANELITAFAEPRNKV